jgi:tripartite ATP-independent transporter DctM subunit
MEWWLVFLIIFGGVVFLLGVGMSVAFAFFLINILGVLALQGGGAAFNQMIFSIYSSVSSFTLLPVPLFVLMGEILWHSKIASRAFDALDKLMGRVPGRLGLLTVLSGTIFSSLSGSTMANTALLGSMLLPDMRKRGYSGDMSIGPILCSGALAMIIPPSALAVIFATIAKLSIGDLLIALILPGLLLAVLYAVYIIGRASLDPAAAPSYDVASVPLSEKLIGLVKYVLPLSIIVFLVVGVIFVGVATPTEAAALGALGSFGMAWAYGGVSWGGMIEALKGTVRISVMMLTIMAAAITFSQILAFSGATRGLLQFVTDLPVAPLVLVILMQIVVLFLGCFMEQIAIMLITLPIFMPIVKSIGVDPIWFAVITLINLEVALMTPPFGMLLFVIRGVAGDSVSMRTIYMSAMPFVAIDLLAIGIIIALPDIALFLPTLSK